MVRVNQSLVVCYTGPRGSGKTLSLVAETVIRLINGHQVWSNIPVSCIWEPTGQHYATIPLNMEALYTFDSGMAEGVVVIDEINLWADSSNWQAVAAKLLAAIFTLIRKRKLSFYLTCQNFNWLHNRLRWQTDVLVNCKDLCHSYPNLSPGQVIHQRLYDVSGVMTGTPFDFSNGFGGTGELLMKGEVFFGCYDTMAEFSPLEILGSKYRVASQTKVIRGGVIESGMPGGLLDNVVFTLDSLRAEGRFEVPVDDMRQTLNDYGVEGDLRAVGRFLKQAGARLKQSRRGNYYEL